MGISINGKHSFNDYGLTLSKVDRGVPIVKTNKIEIVGGDGSLDYTEIFGRVNYSNRQMVLTLNKPYFSLAERSEIVSMCLREFHGKSGKLIFDEDDQYYYEGRMSVTFTDSKRVLKIILRVDAFPYKYHIYPTNTAKVGSGEFHIKNDVMRVVPTITVSKETKIVKGNHEVNLSAGTYVIPEFELVEGDNVFVITNEETFPLGTTNFSFREGAF